MVESCICLIASLLCSSLSSLVGPGSYQVSDDDYSNRTNSPTPAAANAASSPVYHPQQSSLLSQDSSTIRADARSMQLRSHTAPASANGSGTSGSGNSTAGVPATMALNALASRGGGGGVSSPPLSPVASFASSGGIAPRPRTQGNQVATHIMVHFLFVLISELTVPVYFCANRR